MSTTVSATSGPARLSPWRSIGLWMSAFLIIYTFLNVLRATLNPAGFAAYYGLPLTQPDNDAFVAVYAVRTLFLGLFSLALLVRRSYRSLALFALIGTVMPLGDAALVAAGGAPVATVVRHIFVAGFLLLTWFLVRRWAQRSEQAAATA